MSGDSGQASSADVRVAPLPDEALWKPVHTRVTVVLGLGWMLDAFEVNIVGSVLGVLQKLWQLTTEQASLFVSVWLVGIMVGALVFGYLADRFGRRRLFILTLLGYSAFTVISALSPGYYSFMLFRFLTAIGVGAEYSAVNAAIAELIPARYRGRGGAAVMNFWPLGSILAGVITLYFVNVLPPSIGWRFAFASGAIVALFSVWARNAQPESPRWLATRGVASGNVAEESPVRSAAGFFSKFRDLIREHPGRLALGCLLDFSEAAGYYGLFAILPLVVLPRLQIADSAVRDKMLHGSFSEAHVPGLILANPASRGPPRLLHV